MLPFPKTPLLATPPPPPREVLWKLPYELKQEVVCARKEFDKACEGYSLDAVEFLDFGKDSCKVCSFFCACVLAFSLGHTHEPVLIFLGAGGGGEGWGRDRLDLCIALRPRLLLEPPDSFCHTGVCVVPSPWTLEVTPPSSLRVVFAVRTGWPAPLPQYAPRCAPTPHTHHGPFRCRRRRGR